LTKEGDKFEKGVTAMKKGANNLKKTFYKYDTKIKTYPKLRNNRRAGNKRRAWNILQKG
jgi:hypothetical protein